MTSGRSRSYRGVLTACALAASGLLGATPTSAVAGSALYKYDALGRLAEVKFSNGTVVSYTYDAAGNRVAELTAGSKQTSSTTVAAITVITSFLLEDDAEPENVRTQGAAQNRRK